jgi:DNA topoisomerase-1
LLIVESPAKATTINRYLGSDFEVLASYGHVRDLPSRDGVVDPENNFAMVYELNEGSEKAVRQIVKAAKKAEAVYLATDLDREGEAISWHIYEILKEKGLTESIPFYSAGSPGGVQPFTFAVEENQNGIVSRPGSESGTSYDRGA